MNNVLLIGSTGFFGKAIKETLMGKVCLVEVSRSLQEDPSKNNFAMDISSIDQKFLRENKIDAVINCAWMGLNDFTSPVHFENVKPHLNFYEEVLKAGIENVLTFGTCLEYGKREGQLDERMTFSPEVSYAMAKHQVYQETMKLIKPGQCNFKWIIPFYVYGKHQRSSALYPTLLGLKQDQKSLFKMSEGTQVRDFVPVERLAELTSKILFSDFHGIVNCCSGVPKSVYEFILETLKKIGLENKVDIQRGSLSIPAYEAMSFWGSSVLMEKLIS